jgi:hypothetical protein
MAVSKSAMLIGSASAGPEFLTIQRKRYCLSSSARAPLPSGSRSIPAHTRTSWGLFYTGFLQQKTTIASKLYFW